MKKIIALLIIAVLASSAAFAVTDRPKEETEEPKTPNQGPLVVQQTATPIGNVMPIVSGENSVPESPEDKEEPEKIWEAPEKKKAPPEPEKAPDSKKETAEKKELKKFYYAATDEKNNIKAIYYGEKTPSGITPVKISEEQADKLQTYGSYADGLSVSNKNVQLNYENFKSPEGQPTKLTLEIMPNGKIKNLENNKEVNDDRARELYDAWFLKNNPQYKRWFGFLPSLGSLQYYYAAYSGMSGWSSLIFDKEALQKWKTNINEIFCDMMLAKNCWVSKICETYSDIDTSSGIMYTQTSVTSAPRPFAHIEGERGLPVKTGTGTIYIYTITFGLSNPKDKPIKYSITLGGTEGTETALNETNLGKGSTASATGAEAIVRESNKAHTSVCLHFDKIRTFGGKTKSRLCNDLATEAEE